MKSLICAPACPLFGTPFNRPILNPDIQVEMEVVVSKLK